MEQQLNSSTGGWIGDDRRDEADFTSVSQTIAKPHVRAFVLQRAKKFCGKKFKHKGTNHIVETDRFTWDVQVANCFGGLHVACGGYIVWSAQWGWFCEPCN